MAKLHQLLGFLCHKALNKIHVIQISLAGNTEGTVEISLVHQILRPKSIAVFLFKGL